MELSSTGIFIVIIMTIGAYLLGSANFAIIVPKLMYKDDVRLHGSKNAGMTNVLRTYGKLPALITLIGDFSKGIISVLLVRLLLYIFCDGLSFYPAEYIVALAALLGHLFPIYYGFKGGKGILVSWGALMVLSPISGIICFLGFLIAVMLTKYISLGSLVAAILYPLCALVVSLVGEGVIDWIRVLFCLPISALIIFMHRSNIVRLIKGTESKLSFNTKAPNDK